jgi:hypothetical protein
MFRRFWGNSEKMEWLEGLGAKDGALAECKNFSGIFVDFSEWFRTYL